MQHMGAKNWYLYQVVDPMTHQAVEVQKKCGIVPPDGLYPVTLANGSMRVMRCEVLARGVSDEATAERIRSHAAEALQNERV